MGPQLLVLFGRFHACWHGKREGCRLMGFFLYFGRLSNDLSIYCDQARDGVFQDILPESER
jgi:hypothetical protein